MSEIQYVKPGRAYKYYVLLLSTFVCTVSYIDSGLIALMVESIKADLGLSDTQIGLLTGIAFGLFYATLGLPIARWADRGNRSTIAALAIGLWGATVMTCLFITSFAQLLLMRVGAAIGDAGCRPPTYSLLADYFPEPAQRTRAMAIFWSAGPLSTLVSFGAGGWLNEHYGWRMTLFLVGIPGLLTAALIKLSIREPRVALAPVTNASAPQTRVWDVLVLLWQRRSARHLGFAFITLNMLLAGLAPWFAAFLIRSHGMGTTELGIWLGLIFGLGGVAGALLGGYIVAHWFAHDEQKQMRLSAITVGSLVPCMILFLVVPQRWQALLALVPLFVLLSFFSGPTFALLQRLVPADMRATSLSVMMLFATLIGMGIGPLMIGVLSDLLTPAFGSDSLRYAMLIASLAALWSACHFWQAGRTVRDDLQTVATASIEPLGHQEIQVAKSTA